MRLVISQWIVLIICCLAWLGLIVRVWLVCRRTRSLTRDAYAALTGLLVFGTVFCVVALRLAGDALCAAPSATVVVRWHGCGHVKGLSSRCPKDRAGGIGPPNLRPSWFGDCHRRRSAGDKLETALARHRPDWVKIQCSVWFFVSPP